MCYTVQNSVHPLKLNLNIIFKMQVGTVCQVFLVINQK